MLTRLWLLAPCRRHPKRVNAQASRLRAGEDRFHPGEIGEAAQGQWLEILFGLVGCGEKATIITDHPLLLNECGQLAANGFAGDSAEIRNRLDIDFLGVDIVSSGGIPRLKVHVFRHVTFRKRTIADDAEYQKQVDVAVKALATFDQELRKARNMLGPDTAKVPEKRLVYH